MARSPRPALIGAFVVGAVALAIAAAAVLGSGRLFRETHLFVSYFATSVSGLRNGAPVKFKGVQVGEVRKILLNLEEIEGPDETLVPVVFELDADKIRSKGSAVDLSDPRFVRSLIGDGLRASLETESYVTGVRYVSLDFYPGDPVRLVGGPGSTYPEIPSILTGLEQAQVAVSDILSELKQVKVEELVASAARVIKGADRLVNSPELHVAIGSLDEIAKNLKEALVELQGTLSASRRAADELAATVPGLRKELGAITAEARTAMEAVSETLIQAGDVMSPDSPVVHDLRNTLRELADAARAIRELADFLERNPGSVVRGRSAGEEP